MDGRICASGTEPSSSHAGDTTSQNHVTADCGGNELQSNATGATKDCAEPNTVVSVKGSETTLKPGDQPTYDGHAGQ